MLVYQRVVSFLNSKRIGMNLEIDSDPADFIMIRITGIIPEKGNKNDGHSIRSMRLDQTSLKRG